MLFFFKLQSFFYCDFIHWGSGENGSHEFPLVSQHFFFSSFQCSFIYLLFQFVRFLTNTSFYSLVHRLRLQFFIILCTVVCSVQKYINICACPKLHSCPVRFVSVLYLIDGLIIQNMKHKILKFIYFCSCCCRLI